jgi:hypothetical protein
MKKHYNEGRVPLLQESAQVNDLLRKREIQNPMHMLQKTETRSLLEPKRYYLLHFVVIIVNTKIWNANLLTQIILTTSHN